MLEGVTLRRGQKALWAGELELAREHIYDVVRAKPKWVGARLWLASALSELEVYDEALSQLDEAEKLEGGAVVRLWRGRVLFDRRHYSEAREVLESALECGGENFHLKRYLELSRWCSEGGVEVVDEMSIPVGCPELQGRWMLELEERFPGGPGGEYSAPTPVARRPWERFAARRARKLLDRGRARYAEGDPEAALALIERAEELWLDEDAIELHQEALLAVVPLRLERLEEAPHDIELRLELGEALIETGDSVKALIVLDPAAEHIESVDPNRLSWRASLALIRGRAHLMRGQLAEAVEDLEVARELWSVEIEPLYYLAVARLCSGERGQGRRLLVEACSMDGGLAKMRLEEYRASVV